MSKRLSVAISLAVVLLAAGIALGGYFASQAMDGTGVAEEAEKPAAAAPAADSSPTPAVTPDPTAPPSTAQPTRGALGCVDCRVKGGQALRVTAEDVQLGPDVKYYIPDRGDGCAYREDMRGIWELGVEEVVLRAPGCEVFWVYLPATGEVQAWTP